ncbi:MAG: hypothetical protein FWD52_04635 [Candidatus Bathyarchaeota archaeon]|nr:hypothetical protein [Candidatus Termiticorpusculum sp.]
MSENMSKEEMQNLLEILKKEVGCEKIVLNKQTELMLRVIIDCELLADKFSLIRSIFVGLVRVGYFPFSEQELQQLSAVVCGMRQKTETELAKTFECLKVGDVV